MVVLKEPHPFCCAAAGCRKRVTPAALRFWGRRVYLGPVFVLVFSLHHGVTQKRTEELRKQLHEPTLSRHTLRRWRQWWLQVFPRSSFWTTGRARFMPPVDEQLLPASLLERLVKPTPPSGWWQRCAIWRRRPPAQAR